MSDRNIVERLREIAQSMDDDEQQGYGIDHPSSGTLREAADEIERLQRENGAFREAIRTGDGPHCENVCLTECVGPCGVGDDDG